MANTQVATAAAALSWMFVEWIIARKPKVLGMLSGAVAGLVAITPAAGFVAPDGAIYIGLAAGVVCYIGSTWLKRILGYDDSLDAFGIHGIGGALGAILTGVFALSSINSLGKRPHRRQSGSGDDAGDRSCLCGRLLRVRDDDHSDAGQVHDRPRVSEEEEMEGLDITQHGERVH
jgi:Amt family ammonium transporter